MVTEYSLIPSTELKMLQSDNIQKPQVEKNDIIVNVLDQPAIKTLNDAYVTILEYMPKTFLKRAKRILSVIDKHPQIISVNEEGFLLINNVLQDGSDIGDLISALLTVLSRKFQPVGIQAFLAAMAEIKLPLSLIANPKYRKIVMNYSKCRNPKTKLTKKQKIKCLKYY